MKATLKAPLQLWMSRLEAPQDKERDRSSDYDPYSDYDLFLEYKVIGLELVLVSGGGNRQLAAEKLSLDVGQ